MKDMLQKDVAIVTGAASGIGRGIAKALLQAGASVLVADVNEAKTRETTKELQTTYGKEKVACQVVDLRQSYAAEKVAEAALQTFGSIEILVNCAGIYPSTDALQISENEWDRVYDVNVKAVFFLSQAVAKVMIRQGKGGRIINITSTASEVARPGVAHYCSSKAAVNMLTRVLALEWARYGIRINALGPGLVETETLLSTLVTEEAIREHQEKLSYCPMNRAALIEEIAEGVLFFATDQSSYVTGQTLLVGLFGWPRIPIEKAGGKSMNEISRFLQSKQEEMLENLKMVVEHESPSQEKDLTDRLGTKIAKLFEELTGGNTTVIKNDLYGNHIRGEWGSGKEQILILAHFDTVWRQGELKKMPFRITDGKAYGPGIFDMKGGLIQGIYALHALHALQKQPRCKVVCLFTSDEEIGSPTSRTLIEEEAKKSKCVLVLEPAMSPNGALKTSRKGVGIFQLKVKGLPAHSGIDHEKGRSAIEELARQITYLHSLADYGTGITVNVGVIRGGTTYNVVAAEAEALIDLRMWTRAEAERVIPIILGLQPQTKGTEVTVTGELNRPPFERTEQVAALYHLAKKLAKEELNVDLPEAATGGASDGNFTAPLVPTLDGLGAVGDGAHAVHEHLVIAEMPVRSALVALLLIKLGEQPL